MELPVDLFDVFHAIEYNDCYIVPNNSIYTKEEFADYLNKVANTIDCVGYDEEENIGLVLTNCSHAIGLTYNAYNHCWEMMDINRAKIE